MGQGSLYLNAVIGATAATIAAVIAAWVNRRGQVVNESVEITKLQMQTWKDLLAQKDADIDALEARLAALANPAAAIAERDAVIAALSKQNELLHAQLKPPEET